VYYLLFFSLQDYFLQIFSLLTLEIKVELIQLNGKGIWQAQIHGNSHLTIPSRFLNVGTCLVRFTSSGNVLTEQVLLVR
jgi:hypothetical protein